MRIQISRSGTAPPLTHTSIRCVRTAQRMKIHDSMNMTDTSEESGLPFSNVPRTVRHDTKEPERSARIKRGLRKKSSLARPQAKRYLEVIDCPLDGSEIRHVETNDSVEGSGFIRSLPEQSQDVVRVVLDGREKMLEKMEPEFLPSGSQCVNQPQSTYASYHSDPTLNFGKFTHGKAYYWPHLKEVVSDNQSQRWYFIDTFAYHNKYCGYWRHGITSKLRYTGNHESSEAFFTITRDSAGRYISTDYLLRNVRSYC